MTDPAFELARLLDRYGSWRVEYQDHPPAWIATRRPSPAQVHVLAAYDLDSLRDKLASAEAISDSLAALREDSPDRGPPSARSGPAPARTRTQSACMPGASAF